MNLEYLKNLERNDLCKRLFYRKNKETNETVVVNFDNYMGKIAMKTDHDLLLCIDGNIYSATGECLNKDLNLMIAMEATSRFIRANYE